MNNLQLLRMMQVCDSLFPIGAFTLSNGLETLVQQGRIQTAEELQAFLQNYLKILPFNELGAAALACRYMAVANSERMAKENDGQETLKADGFVNILWLDRWMSAAKGPEELRVGSRRLCQRLLKVVEKIAGSGVAQTEAHRYPALQAYQQAIARKQAEGVHGIAIGLYLWDLGCGEEPAEGLQMFCYSLISAMVTNCVKLVPLSQMEGQRVLDTLFPEMEQAVARALRVEIEEIGIGGAGFDLCSMEHETLYTRMYIS